MSCPSNTFFLASRNACSFETHACGPGWFFDSLDFVMFACHHIGNRMFVDSVSYTQHPRECDGSSASAQLSCPPNPPVSVLVGCWSLFFVGGLGGILWNPHRGISLCSSVCVSIFPRGDSFPAAELSWTECGFRRWLRSKPTFIFPKLTTGYQCCASTIEYCTAGGSDSETPRRKIIAWISKKNVGSVDWFRPWQLEKICLALAIHFF